MRSCDDSHLGGVSRGEFMRELLFVRTQRRSGKLSLKRQCPTACCFQRCRESLTDDIAIVGKAHPGGKFSGILPAIGKHHQLPAGLLCCVRHLAQERVGEHLSDALKAGAHRADWRIKPPPATIFIAARTNGRVGLVGVG